MAVYKLTRKRWRILDNARMGVVRYLCQKYQTVPRDVRVLGHPLYLAIRELWTCAYVMRVSEDVDRVERAKAQKYVNHDVRTAVARALNER